MGVYDGAQFDPVKGSLRPGDVLMLFTDGLVETSERDISEGIDCSPGKPTAMWRAASTAPRGI